MNQLIRQFEFVVAHNPDQLALVEDTRSVTYRELYDLVERITKSMQQAGLTERMHIALDGVNSIEFIAAYLAVAKLGACTVPIDSRLSTVEVKTLLIDSQPNAYVIFARDTPLANWALEQGLHSRFEFVGFGGKQITLQVDPQRMSDAKALVDDLVVQYSSGSTGLPKGVVLSATNIFHKVTNWNSTLEITSDDVFLCTLTLSHCYGMYVHTLAGLLAGARVVLPDLATLTPGRIARLIKEHQVTVFGSLPYMFQLLLALPIERLPLETIRYLISGSAPLPEVTAHSFHNKFGRHLNQVYGLTEIGLITFNKNPVNPMSLGGLTANMQARVVDDQGQECPDGEPGELAVQCTSMARGYLNSPEEQQQMFRNGWLHTKDIVRRMPDGSFQMCGRLSQFINVGGNKVSPGEVENALLAFPGVREAAVVGRRHETTTEEVVAFVVVTDPTNPPSLSELTTHCKSLLSSYKMPRDIRFVVELPKSPLGKVLKPQLFAAQMVPAQPETI